MIAGVGLPVNLELEAVTMGFAFKSSFVLPMNASDFWAVFSEPFDATSHPITVFQRSIDETDESTGFDNEQNEKYERHHVKAEIMESAIGSNFNSVENSDQSNGLASTRWIVYKGLAEIAEKFVFLKLLLKTNERIYFNFNSEKCLN